MTRVARAGVGAALLASAAVAVALTGVPGSARESADQTVGATAASATTTEQRPIRVLLAGDSITQGFNGDYTWRYRLWREFQRQHVRADFVGSRHLPFVQEGFRTAHYADPHFDTDHFAITGTLLSSLAGRIRNEVAVQRPDVLVLEGGVNDLLHGRTPEQTADALRHAIAEARSARPNLRIVICPVLGVRRSQPTGLRAEIRTYNGLVRDIVGAESTSFSPVVMAHTRDGWSVERDTYAGLHPNPTGEALIAQHVAEALTTLGVLPERPTILAPGADDVWHRNLVPDVAVEGGRAVVTWDDQALSGAQLRWREKGGSWRVVPQMITGGRFDTRLLAPGDYEFQLLAIRKRMSSPYGPTAQLTVPGA